MSELLRADPERNAIRTGGRLAVVDYGNAGTIENEPSAQEDRSQAQGNSQWIGRPQSSVPESSGGLPASSRWFSESSRRLNGEMEDSPLPTSSPFEA